MYAARGWLYEALKQYDKARADFEKAVELGATDFAPLTNVALRLALSPAPELCDPKRAVTLATKAVELKPKDWKGWYALGMAHHRAGDPRAAVVAVEKSSELAGGGNGASKAHPLNGLAWKFATCADAKLRDAVRAVTLGKKAVELLGRPGRPPPPPAGPLAPPPVISITTTSSR
jgi:tetratricopeptide (TPR) repeat protein